MKLFRCFGRRSADLLVPDLPRPGQPFIFGLLGGEQSEQARPVLLRMGRVRREDLEE